MRRFFTQLLLVVLSIAGSYQLYGQCDGSGYSDLSGPCATSVCSYDAYCCDTEWDNVCAAEAASDAACEYCWTFCEDNDFDGYSYCDGDCDDFDPSINPGATEICSNGIDEDCDGYDGLGCDQAGYSNLTSDCAVAVCDLDGFCCTLGWDAVCAGEAISQEACQSCWCGCYDNDLDGFTNCDGDCDDFNPDINPDAAEICSNGIDEDCNGIADDDFGSCDVAGYTDLAGACATSLCSYDPYCCDTNWDIICAAEAAGDINCAYCICGCYDIDEDGYTNCDGDCDDFNANINPDQVEICSNGIDEDCSGIVDDNPDHCDAAGYSDLISDCAFDVCNFDPYCCNVEWDNFCASAAIAFSTCQSCWCGCYDNDLDGFTNCENDCDDYNDQINPDASETCNQTDDDCDGLIDDGLATSVYYRDADGDGFGDLLNPFNLCTLFSGYVANNLDCNDSNPSIYTGSTEVCNGLDDDCDLLTDEGVQNTYYRDNDGDGYGDPLNTTLACSTPVGYVSDDTDCDDTDELIYPGATEVCNTGDDDCDGATDEGVQNTYYLDDDGDGFGDASETTQACSAPSGYVSNDTDCDDTDENVNPDATEICSNNIDDDCEGTIDITSTACDQSGYSDLAGPCAAVVCDIDPYCCDTEWDNVCAGEALIFSECQYCLCGCYDFDGDGYTNCDGDCDDFNVNINPGLEEYCDLFDNDCDGDINEDLEIDTYYSDVDGDGYGDPNSTVDFCALPFGYSLNNLDCDDNNADIRPNAPEICNTIDDNCNGFADEGATFTYYADNDGDGFGNPFSTTESCNQPTGYVPDNSDCNDENADINISGLEVCNNEDDNCDGSTDEGLALSTYYADSDGDGYGDPGVTTLSCQAFPGWVSDNTDCNDFNAAIYPGATEICNNSDDDCDGNTDEGVLNTYYTDSDGDGFGDPSNSTESCDLPEGYADNNTDCDDDNGDVNPSATEVCGNDTDDDCNGNVDDAAALTFYADSDGDGFGDASSTMSACVAPDGFVDNDEDCDDSDSNVNPNANESCVNGIDDDCDGDTDEGELNTYFLDNDGDGYGDSSISISDCAAPTGYVTDDTDCDDTDENINPGMEELCGNGIDDDCDDDIDETGLNTYYADADGDGYGDPSTSLDACTEPEGYVLDNTDCDDTDENINPEMAEVCGNGSDDDCDGDVDEVPLNSYFADADGDGYGDVNVSLVACTAPDGYVNDDTDCDDTDENINPAALDICGNGEDDDCDGSVDESGDISYYLDSDGDGYGDAMNSIETCIAPDGYVSNDQDCDDSDANVNPAQNEICGNGTDDDCDGDVDNVDLSTFYADSDGDGYGDAAVSIQDCVAPTGYVDNNDDCDDTDENINQDATEICGNGTDEDCDGFDNVADITYYQDNDGDGYGNPSVSVVNCTPPSGFVENNEDCDDADENINPGATEICGNGIDEDCDFEDETGSLIFFADADGDGYGDAGSVAVACSLPTGYVENDQDCDDSDENINPGMDDICGNDTDEDCDGFDNTGENTYYIDADGDGYGDPSVTIIDCTTPSGYSDNNEDCDDTDENINPGMSEVCNNTDDNCDGNSDEGIELTTYFMDSDGDGYGDLNVTMESCEMPEGYVADNTDCDDTNENINPAASEVCNGADDNCDGNSDEGLPLNTYYADSDGDGYGDLNATTSSCGPVEGYVSDNTDCDDTDANVNPAATEVCDDIDNDCDGSTDEDLEVATYYADNDGDGFGAEMLGDFCSAPANSSLVDGDCDDNNNLVYPDATEYCDGIDNDCDEETDDNVVFIDYYEDLDGDGFGAVFLGNFCEIPNNGVTESGDCNDDDADVNPGASEICNDADDNCDGNNDEGLEFLEYFADNDGDGFGATSMGTFCSPPNNASLASGDCDDENSNVYPGAPEFCNENDDDCDGNMDNDVVYSDYYADADGDGFGGELLGNFCVPPANSATNNADCDDSDAGIYPNAPEFCDSADNDCDGETDEGLITATYYADNDGDAVGAELLGDFCFAPANASLITGDCNDNDANVYPGAPEVCNSNDDDCDEAVDEDVLNSYYADGDGDGYGDITALVLACDTPNGYVANSDDCDDDNEAINPDAIEYCDGIDNNCNEAIDDNCIISVEELNAAWTVSIYPNPVRDQFGISVEGISGQLEYFIYDAPGRLIFSGKINGSGAMNNIDANKLSQGSYTISVVNGADRVISKFVKL